MIKLPFKLALIALWIWLGVYPPQGAPTAASTPAILSTTGSGSSYGSASSTFIGYFVNGTTPTETNVQVICPRAGTLSNLYFNIGTNTLNAGCTVTVTSRKNGVNGNLVVTFTGSTASSTIVSDTTHTDSVNAGDRVNLIISTSGFVSGTIANFFFSAEIT